MAPGETGAVSTLRRVMVIGSGCHTCQRLIVEVAQALSVPVPVRAVNARR
jgi:bacterioferritin-associated ferredoxin